MRVIFCFIAIVTLIITALTSLTETRTERAVASIRPTGAAITCCDLATRGPPRTPVLMP